MKLHITLMISCLLCIIVILILLFRLQDKDELLKQKDSVIAEKNDSITYHKNANGKIVAEKNVAVLRAKDIEDSYPKIVEDLKKDFDARFKDVKAYVSNQFVVHGSGKGTVVNHFHNDSTGNKFDSSVFKMNDKFLDFKVTMYFDRKDAPYTYSYSDRAQTAFISDHRWYRPFRKETITAKTVFDNPNAKVINTTNILTQEYKDRRWVLSVGINYNPFASGEWYNKVGPGIHVGYAAFKF